MTRDRASRRALVAASAALGGRGRDQSGRVAFWCFALAGGIAVIAWVLQP